MRATPTKLIVKEYGNYVLGVGVASITMSAVHWGAYGELPKAGTILAIGGAVATFPALGLIWKSWRKIFGATSPATLRHEVTAGGGLAPINREINGMAAFFKNLPFDPRLAFDPNYKNDPDVKSTTIKYKEEAPQLKWWQVDVMKRADRPTIITVTLYEDLVMQIVEKGWRVQRRGKAHPISQHYLCSLHYEALGGQRLDDVTFLAFKKLGEQYRLFTGAPRQGTSGKLANSPIWCRRQLGLSS